jgi:exopolysaccharide/PEP-CTERM locus tyrosine autokinase
MSRIEEALRKATKQWNQGDISHGPTREVESASGLNQDRVLNKSANELLNVKPLEVTNVLLATAQEEKNRVVEEFNKLRSSIIALTKGDKFLNTLLVTSTVSEEGKSMTALNLAISLAKEQDYTVLLVDADLRRPSIHKFLNLDPDKGLVHCLRDGVPISDVLIKTGIGKLVILPAGELVKDPLDMLSSNRMKEIVNELKDRYSERYVIFDTPPAKPYADAGVLAGMVDSTLFVVREGLANREIVQKTLDEFKEHNMLGVVYNDAQMFVNKQEYYY